jgi:hypothetical protein
MPEKSKLFKKNNKIASSFSLEDLTLPRGKIKPFKLPRKF